MKNYNNQLSIEKKNSLRDTSSKLKLLLNLKSDFTSINHYWVL